MTYTVLINNKEIEVSYKIYVAHCSMEFDSIQSLSTYNKFLYKYKIASKDIIPFIKTYLDKDTEHLNTILNKEIVKVLLNNSRWSLLYLAAVADYLVTADFSFYTTSKEIKTKLLEKYINYNTREFSLEYESLQPLTQFYHSLIYEIDMEKIVTRKVDKFIRPTRHISIDRIKTALKELGQSIEIKDIRRDIDNHGVLLDMGDYFVWSSNMFKQWFWKASYNDVYILNLSKLISKNVYN